MAILGAELIGTVGAFQGFIGEFPKALGIEQNRNLPHKPHKQRQPKQAQSIESAHEDQGAEHHQMVPIENTAGGTAAGFKNQPKRTPYKHTDQIAHVESDRDKQQYIFVDDIEEIQAAYKPY